MSVTDEGCGLPAGFDPTNAGLGRRWIGFVRQLRGRLILGSQETGRARITVNLPASGTVTPS